MYDYTIERTDIKLELLHEQMQAAAVAGLTGLSDRRGQIVAHFESQPGADVLAVVDGLVTAHDPAGQTASEIKAVKQAAARAAAAADQLLSRIDAGLTANSTDQDANATDAASTGSITTVAASRVAITRLLEREARYLNREAAIIDTIRKILVHLRTNA